MLWSPALRYLRYKSRPRGLGFALAVYLLLIHARLGMITAIIVCLFHLGIRWARGTESQVSEL
jgi:hypothetical protein